MARQCKRRCNMGAKYVHLNRIINEHHLNNQWHGRD